MSDKPFHFKEFSILQDRCAMKVGTDGVLLGAWVRISPDTESILDIGTGTGLIALQMAQRSNAETIDAIEIENRAFEQAVENFENSSWADRLYCYHASLLEFKEEMEDQYDLIISNPPYFNDTFKELNKERALARHTHQLSYKELLEATDKLLSPSGSCAFIIPYREESDFLSLAALHKLYPILITRVRGTEQSDIKRSLLQFSRHSAKVVPHELIIEKSRHVYTDAYSSLVKDFYLHM
ncbi:tRNA1(Val) (adenine(37)-N6)-methyltransferase [Lutimonas sp.]|uniref:tRNA1(Val) (adenine(37)-N6)-methyltransferase n=1 Tax=Lutimonas sp. TaxID=1872403 RepID=UPI003C73F325